MTSLNTPAGTVAKLKKQSKSASLVAKLNTKTSAANTCQQCETRKEAPLHNAYNPLCLPCGAIGIASLQRMNIDKEQKKARLTAWLQHWMTFGHSESELRRLAKG
jgi:hypothetical protein